MSYLIDTLRYAFARLADCLSLPVGSEDNEDELYTWDVDDESDVFSLDAMELQDEGEE